MKKTWFHYTVTILTITILLAIPLQRALADGAGEGIEREANGYHIRLIFVESPRLGANEFHVQITDAMGMPVANADAGVIAMPNEIMSEHEEDTRVDAHGSDSMSGMDMPTEEAAPTDDMNGMSGMDMGNEPEANEPSTHGEAQDSHGETQDSHTAEPTQVVLEAGHEPGEYSGHVSFNRTGEWIFNIHFTVDGQLTEVEFPVIVAGLDAKYGILAGFVGINASVMTAAAIIKRKKNSIQA
ncbi:MAG: hypothetical protein QY332_15465 [Anaerolineales bacterium]|nr:MAG: hypothetical protein QY332_15465 [Anaerolineales bacterium]